MRFCSHLSPYGTYHEHAAMASFFDKGLVVGVLHGRA